MSRYRLNNTQTPVAGPPTVQDGHFDPTLAAPHGAENSMFDQSSRPPRVHSVDRVGEAVDLLLQRLKTREENGINET